MKFSKVLTKGHVLCQRYDFQEWCDCPKCEGAGTGEPMFWIKDIDLIEDTVIWFVPADDLMDKLDYYMENENIAILSDGCTECLGSRQGITPELSQDESNEIFLDFIFQCGLWALGQKFDIGVEVN